jgi:hypothetical protein
MKEQNITYNMAQLYMLGHAKHVLTVNGGNAILSAYFGEDVIMYGHPDCPCAWRIQAKFLRLTANQGVRQPLDCALQVRALAYQQAV